MGIHQQIRTTPTFRSIALGKELRHGFTAFPDHVKFRNEIVGSKEAGHDVG